MTSEFDAGPIYTQGALPWAIMTTRPPTRPASSALLLAEELVAEAFHGVKSGDPGDPQDEADASYAGPFEPAYLEVDWERSAREIHNQTGAWKLSSPLNGVRGPLTWLEGRRVRLLRTRLGGDRGGLRVGCGDGPRWVLQAEPVEA
jgi:methionyl-tRNA formyltransferase